MTDELSVTAKQQTESYIMPRRINKKVSKIMDASALEKFKDTQAKNEHFERYNKETDKDKKKKMLSEALAEGWL
tara:strand:- start:100 stop:321 length:222 start_codon:yes stop_codon:yes gene_type:complete